MIFKKRSFIILVVSTLIIVVAYFAYQSVIGPIYSNNVSQHMDVNFVESKAITLHKKQDQGSIFSIELEILGNTSSNLNLSISNGEKVMYDAKIKGGEIDFAFKNDWYVDSLVLLISPTEPGENNLNIDYRFLAL